MHVDSTRRSRGRATSRLLAVRRGCVLLGALLVAGLVAPAVRATSFIAPAHLGELLEAADIVVLARAGESSPRARGAMILTDTSLEVLEVLAGPVAVGEEIVLQSPGGRLDDREWRVPGSPRLEPGETYLLPLQGREDGRWIPIVLSYGLLREATGADGSALLVPFGELSVDDAFPRPDGVTPEPIVSYRRDALLSHARELLAAEATWSRGLVEASVAAVDGRGEGAEVPAGCSFFSSNGAFFRWRDFDRGGIATIFTDDDGDPSLANLGFPVIQEAMDLWMDISDTGCNLRYGGARPTVPSCGGGQDSVGNTILFNDPCSDIGDLQGCGGVLAYGGPIAQGTHTFDGATWITCTGWIVVVNNGAGCLGVGNYRIMMAHELGHGLGFGHVDDSGALMFANCCRSPNTTDRTCVRYTYPKATAANTRPRADAGGGRTLALAGNRARLRGSVEDDGLPAPASIETTWTRLAGPGTVSFEDASALETTASFSASGTYLLGLEAYDGEMLHIDTFTVNVEVFVGGSRTMVFQEGVDGYRGTVDTFIAEDAPGATNGAAASVEVDADDPGGSGLATQGLLRFDDLFDLGGSGAGLPLGAAVRSARLELETTNAGAGASLHRMLEPWSESTSWGAFGADGIQPGDEAEPSADASTGGALGTTTIDVTDSLREWAIEPDTNLGWALLPAGDDGWDFDSSEGTVPPRLVVEIASVATDRLVAVGDEWQYRAGTTAPPVDWALPGAELGPEWRSGPSGIGYGDDDDATVITDMEDRYLTLFCRREIAIEDPTIYGRLVLRIDYDDGFVAYLNGVEVARSGSMAGAPSPVDRNRPADYGREAGEFEEYEVDASALRTGVNVLAIEVHNTDLSSSDLSMIPELVGEVIFVAGGASWRYRRGSESLTADWAAPGFDDSSWDLGEAGIGYGDGDDFTELLDMRGSYLSVFCRHEFEVLCPERVASLELTTVYDDGVVLYLNGEEIGRENMPSGGVGRNTPASGSIEPRAATLEVPVELLLPGRNVLAASVHNSDLDSSDLSFFALLVPTLRPAGEATCDDLGPRFVRGDSVGDGTLDVSDAVRTLLFLFGGEAALPCADSADFDDDGELLVTDPVALLGYLFQGGAPPAPPGVDCGADPTDDELPECVASGC